MTSLFSIINIYNWDYKIQPIYWKYGLGQTRHFASASAPGWTEILIMSLVMNMSWAMRASDSFPSSTLFKLVCESSISCTCDIFSYVFSISSFSSDISTYIYCLMHLFFFLWRCVFSRYLSFLLWNKDGRLGKRWSTAWIALPSYTHLRTHPSAPLARHNLT